MSKRRKMPKLRWTNKARKNQAKALAAYLALLYRRPLWETDPDFIRQIQRELLAVFP